MKHKLLFVIMVYLITTNSPVMAQAPELTMQERIKAMSVEEIINYIAPQFKQDPKLVGKVTWCESHNEVKSHDGGRGVNVTGIHDATFKGWLPKYVKDTGETLDISSTYDQIKMMSWAFSKGASYRNQWTTYVAYTKGGKWTFYSHLMKRTYTVHCK